MSNLHDKSHNYLHVIDEKKYEKTTTARLQCGPENLFCSVHAEPMQLRDCGQSDLISAALKVRRCLPTSVTNHHLD